MRDTGHHLWSLGEDDQQSVGLSCSEAGLFLGRTPLLESHDGGFAPRRQHDLERILSHGFGIDVALDGVMGGLRTVASALNQHEFCRARIAAVHLRIPELPDELARLAMETEDLLVKVEARSNHYGQGDWDPAKHPRTGTSPNPGWFAPTDGAGGSADLVAEADQDKPLRLPPGERNDEMGDLLEWIANAKPEDVPAISGEISRLFYQHGDFADGAALHQALIEALENPDRANRQRILDQYEPITHHDPSAGETIIDVGAMAGLRLPGRGVGIATPTAEATAAASDVWALGWARRGREIEEALGNNLGPTFPVIDRYENGIVTSIKSIDLNSPIYQDGRRLLARINDYSFKLLEFNGTRRGEDFVEAGDITSRVLDVAVPKIRITAEQRAAFEAARAQAKQYGVTLNIIPF